MNIRHDFTSEEIQIQTDKSIAQSEKICFMQKCTLLNTLMDDALGIRHPKWINQPPTFEGFDRYRDMCIEQELNYYSNARVLQAAPNRFFITYSDKADSEITSGTGAFKTLDEAKGWYLRSGR